MGTALVVVGDIPCEHGPQVTFADDEKPVGDLAPDGADEPLGIAVRSRTSRRNLDHLDTSAGQDSVERGGELAGPVTNQEPEIANSVTQVHQH
jgi:hypothetical protein